MKYLVEINGDTEKGSELMRFIHELNAKVDDVHIIHEYPLRDEEMALPPTRVVSDIAMDAWLKPSTDEIGMTADEAVTYIRDKRAK